MCWRKTLICIAAVAGFFSAVWISPAFSNTVPPTPTQHFYGDADGDTLITTFDLGILVNYFNGQPYTFETLQPQNPDQDWNTCDLDSDRHCTTFDLGIYANYFNGQTVTIGDKPWALQNVNLPLTGNTANTWIPFTINLYSTLPGPVRSGRPGVSVVAEIDPLSEGTGKLSGRHCDPDLGGGLNQAAQAGAQCALSVTTTDWDNAPSTALTESGTYGLAVWGNGDGNLTLKIRIEEVAALDIPAVNIITTIGFCSGPAGVWYVKADATGANNGTSWADAFTVVQSGVNAASSGEQVWVAQGTYLRPGSGTIPVLAMKAGVLLYGGFVGSECLLSQRGNPMSRPTILDGEGTSYHVVTSASNSRLDGFFITGGNANGASPNNYGGGIYNTGTTGFTLANSIIERNRASSGGGGILNSGLSGLTAMNNIIVRNHYNGNKIGGAILNTANGTNTPLFTNCIIANNVGSQGGGIYDMDGYGPDIYVNCVFSGNIPSNSNAGGAMFAHRFSMPLFRNVIMWSDSRAHHDDVGYDAYATPSAYYSDFWFTCYLSPCTGVIMSNPLFANTPDVWDYATTTGATSSVTVPSGTYYHVNDVIEIGDDDIVRTVSGVVGNLVSFSPALLSPVKIYTIVQNWGPGATNLVEDLHLLPGSPAINAGDPAPIYNDPDGSRNDMGYYGGPGAPP